MQDPVVDEASCPDLGLISAWAAAGPALACSLAISEKFGYWFAIPPDTKLLPEIFRRSAIGNCSYDGLDQIRFLTLIVGFPILFGLFYFLSRKLSTGKRLLMLTGVAVAVELTLIVFTFMNWRLQSEQTSLYFPSYWVGICFSGLGLFILAAQSSLGKKAWETTAALLGNKYVFWCVAIGYSFWRLSPSIHTTANLGLSDLFVWYHLNYTLDEFAAVMNGRFPLVDFFPQYTNLMPFLAFPIFKVLGLSVTTFSLLMNFMSFLIFLCVLSILNQVIRRREIVLLLFIPLVAVSTYAVPGMKFFGPFNYHAIGPIRYFVPMIVAWLCSVNLVKTSPTRLFALFFLAGLGVINNLDFGVPAFGAAFLSLLIGYRKPMAIVKAASGGLISSFVIFSALSWLSTGEMPGFDKIIQFQKIFALYGFFMLPMPKWGQHVLEELVFFAAIAVGIVRLFSLRILTDELRLRTGMLVFSGIFGLGTLVYFVGRSHFQVLAATFLAWALCLSLLIWECKVGLSFLRGNSRRLLFIPMAWLGFMYAGFATQVPLLANPVDEFQRFLVKSGAFVDQFSAEVSKIREEFPSGGKTLIVAPFGHMLAQDAGVSNLSPYPQDGSILLLSQVELLLQTVDKNDLRTLFGYYDSEVSEGLLKRNFKKVQTLNPEFEVWKKSDLLPGAN